MLLSFGLLILLWFFIRPTFIKPSFWYIPAFTAAIRLNFSHHFLAVILVLPCSEAQRSLNEYNLGSILIIVIFESRAFDFIGESNSATDNPSSTFLQGDS